MKLKRIIKRGEKIWSNNPIALLFLYTPASIITSILTIPMIILARPATLFGRGVERKWSAVLISLQHSIGLSFWYFVADYIFPSIFPLNPFLNFCAIIALTFFNFRITIKSLTQESLKKAYGH